MRWVLQARDRFPPRDSGEPDNFQVQTFPGIAVGRSTDANGMPRDPTIQRGLRLHPGPPQTGPYPLP